MIIHVYPSLWSCCTYLSNILTVFNGVKLLATIHMHPLQYIYNVGSYTWKTISIAMTVMFSSIIAIHTSAILYFQSVFMLSCLVISHVWAYLLYGICHMCI